MKKGQVFSIVAVFFIFTLIAVSAFVPWGKGRYLASGRTTHVGYVDPQIPSK